MQADRLGVRDGLLEEPVRHEAGHRQCTWRPRSWRAISRAGRAEGGEPERVRAGGGLLGRGDFGARVPRRADAVRGGETSEVQPDASARGFAGFGDEDGDDDAGGALSTEAEGFPARCLTHAHGARTAKLRCSRTRGSRATPERPKRLVVVAWRRGGTCDVGVKVRADSGLRDVPEDRNIFKANSAGDGSMRPRKGAEYDGGEVFVAPPPTGAAAAGAAAWGVPPRKGRRRTRRRGGSDPRESRTGSSWTRRGGRCTPRTRPGRSGPSRSRTASGTTSGAASGASASSCTAAAAEVPPAPPPTSERGAARGEPRQRRRSRAHGDRRELKMKRSTRRKRKRRKRARGL